MKKRIMLVGLLSLCILVLCACQSGTQQKYPVATLPTQAVYQSGSTDTANSLTGGDSYTDFDTSTYNPASEEYGTDGQAYDPYEAGDIPTAAEDAVITTAPTVRSEYAGATPVVIDPIDKPTPTPVPALTFTYQVYDATKLHLSFEAPVGWTVNDGESDTYILTNPDPAVDYAATLTVRAVSVTSDYTTNDLKKEINQMLDTIGSVNFSTYSPSNTAERTLLDKAGVYANYKGTLAGGVQVAGRVHATCINKVLYTMHLSYPQAMTNSYVENVYTQFRHTVKITQ